MRLLLALTLLASFSVHAAADDAAKPAEAKAADAKPSEAKPPTAGSIEVYAIDCGHFTFKDLGFFSDTGEYDGKPGTKIDTCVLVHHPDGWMLWDTGVPDALAKGPIDTPMAKMARTGTLEAALGELKLTPADIKFVGISHSHFDHTGNLAMFPAATVLLQQKEFDAITGPTPPPGTEPATIAAYKAAKTNLLHGDFDVFGDGRVKILTTPGHTAGHQSLLLKLKSGNVIFSGDLWHARESLVHKRVPIFNFDRAQTLASMDRVERLAQTFKAKIFIQHDEGDFARLPKFPAALK
ncbi:MAG: N-acyl homoserine lactonase family protein [Deltaproteobacteria bacterium]|nr:N-acyl homoserine lactonase family protein [Deltaproteobacteria bacterium]